MIRKFAYSLMITAGLALSLAGCSKNTGPENVTSAEDKPVAEEASAVEEPPAVEEAEAEEPPAVEETVVTGTSSSAENTDGPENKETAEDPETAENAGTAADSVAAEDAQTNEDTSTDNNTNTGDNAKFDVIWIGDSLTQGSLGDDNHNKNNPQAPWRVLGEISGKNVTGVGFYGYKTHDIFWAYGEYDGIKDPNITYVYWVGSNDFHDSPDNIKYVIEETDRFNLNAGITKYIMLGTTNRSDMDPNAYIGINKGLKDYYGDRYLDIMPYVEFGPDGVHLTEASYRKIAGAVYDKLRSMGYL